MPDYVKGLRGDAQVFALDKRDAAEYAPGSPRCSRSFDLANNPRQWVSDYMEFISKELGGAHPTPKNVLLVGVSEGALVAAKVARSRTDITHLAIIGDGGWTMRASFAKLAAHQVIPFDVENGWKEIATDVQSVKKQWFGNPYRWWFDIMDLDPLPDYLALNIPIIVGFGENDQSVPVESALFLESKFKEIGKSNLNLIVYSGADHRLNTKNVAHRPELFEAVSRLLR